LKVVIRRLLLMDIKNWGKRVDISRKAIRRSFIFFLCFFLFPFPLLLSLGFSLFLLGSTAHSCVSVSTKLPPLGLLMGVCLMYVPSRSCGVGGGYGLGKGNEGGFFAVCLFQLGLVSDPLLVLAIVCNRDLLGYIYFLLSSYLKSRIIGPDSRFQLLFFYFISSFLLSLSGWVVFFSCKPFISAKHFQPVP